MGTTGSRYGAGMIRRRAVVSGYVQGVYFRESCRQKAAVLSVAGWVRNRSDRTVEMVFEGEQPAVERMIDWTRRGPEDAHVTGVEVFEEEPEGLVGFAVLPTR
jgi:acylphosphatase